jgi:hypothetical protein
MFIFDQLPKLEDTSPNMSQPNKTSNVNVLASNGNGMPHD